MWGAASNLSPHTVHALAIYFSMLPPEAANDGDRERVAAGKTISQVGLPDSNIAACVACHGPNAQGIGDIPSLGGLAYTYLKRVLEQWGEGYHATAKAPMPRRLGPSPARLSLRRSSPSFLIL
jgi:cytochrome c553